MEVKLMPAARRGPRLEDPRAAPEVLVHLEVPVAAVVAVRGAQGVRQAPMEPAVLRAQVAALEAAVPEERGMVLLAMDITTETAATVSHLAVLLVALVLVEWVVLVLHGTERVVGTVVDPAPAAAED